MFCACIAVNTLSGTRYPSTLATKAALTRVIPHFYMLVLRALYMGAFSLQLLCVLVNRDYQLDGLRKAYETFLDPMNGLFPPGLMNWWLCWPGGEGGE